MNLRTKVSGKYVVATQVEGFDVNQELDSDDFTDAISHSMIANDEDEDFWQVVSDQAYDIIHSNQLDEMFDKTLTYQDPEDFIDIGAFTKQDKGWLLDLPEEDWETELKSEYSRDYNEILKLRKQGKLPPAISINDEMGDGRGRTLLQYALNQKIPVLNLELKKSVKKSEWI